MPSMLIKEVKEEMNQAQENQKWEVTFKARGKSGFEKYSTIVSATKHTQARKFAIEKAELEGVHWVRSAQSKIKIL